MRSGLTILMLIILLTCPAAATTTIEFVGGGLTYHMEDIGQVSSRFANKVSANGQLIANPTFGLTLGEDDGKWFTSITGFGGENSIAKPIGGLLAEFGNDFGKHWQVGAALGGYVQNQDDFRAAGINEVAVNLNTATSLVPVIGLAVNAKADLSEATFVKANLIVGPMIANLTFSVGLRFN